MGISVADNFSYLGGKPLDGRIQYATLAAMKAMADATLYEGCEAYCIETDKYYQWKSSNTVDADTGKWREVESGGGSIPVATANTLGGIKVGSGLSIDENGVLSATGGGGGAIELDDVSDVSASLNRANLVVKLKWTDPDDIVISGYTFARWGATVIVRKENSAPASPTDGVVVLTSTIKDQYALTAYEDSVQANKIYYYRFFPKTTRDLYTYGTIKNVDTNPLEDYFSFSQNGDKLYAGNSDTTYTATKAERVLAINCINQSLGKQYGGDLSQSIVTTGNILCSFTDNSTADAGTGVLTENFSHAYQMSVIDLNIGDTVQFSTAYAGSNPYLGRIALVYKALIPWDENTFGLITIRGMWYGSSSYYTGNYSYTVVESGKYIALVVNDPANVTYSQLLDCSIKVNDIDITTIQGCDQAKEEPTSIIRYNIAELELNEGDEVKMTVATGNQQGAFMILAKLAS